MRYKYIIPTLCIFGTMSLHAEENALGDILQQVGEKKRLVKPIPKKKESKKQTRFVFTDEYDSNGIGLKDKSVAIFIGSWHGPNIDCVEKIIKMADSWKEEAKNYSDASNTDGFIISWLDKEVCLIWKPKYENGKLSNY